MSETSPFEELDSKKLPTTLNVLTILTFIGSSLFGIVGGIAQYVLGEKNLQQMEAASRMPNFDKMPDFVKKMNSPEAIAQARIVVENKLPITILAFVGGILCIYGAIEMRKLKKTGFYSYIVGCILPFLGFLIFVGASYFSQYGVIFWVVINIAFVALYAAQSKYLINK